MKPSLRYAASSIAVLAAISLSLFYWNRGDAGTDAGSQADALAEALSDRKAVPRPLSLNPLDGFAISREDRQKLLSEATRWCYLKSPDQAIRIHALRLRNVVRDRGEGGDLRFYDKLLLSMLDDSDPKVGAVFSILFRTPYGAAYRVKNPDDAGADYAGGITHVDKVLSVMGELGQGLETAVVTHDGERLTLADVLEDSLKRSRPGREVEWSLVAYCDYLSGQNRWVSGSGDVRSVDDILEEVLRRRGACFGSHRLYALAKAVQRAGRDPAFFRADLIAQAESELRLASKHLVKCQRADGSWPEDWIDEPPAPAGGVDDQADVRLLLSVTGHMLEWFAVASDDLRPPPEVIERAARYVLRQLVDDPERHFGGDRLAGVTHAVRGLFHLCDDTLDPGEAPTISHN